MRNYIKLNGNNSNDITGLLIQELPPITKPKIRTQIEEINGRDGDIVTNLGYSAYNKEISIGLYGNYNVDDVIAYFNNNKTGEVIFSNEPDKYYNYEIFEQIDFDRLIRFRTATVKMHVQPFKYPTEEEQITASATVITGEGNELSLNNTKEGTPLEIGLKGNTYQETTTGKNLANISIIDQVPSISNGQLVSFTGAGCTELIEIDNTKNMTLSYELSTNTEKYIFFYNASQQFLGVTSAHIASGYQLQTSQYYSQTKYVRVRFDNVSYIKWVQLEYATTPTSYEPYTNGASPNPDYPQEVQVVTGDNTIKVVGKNLINMVEANKGTNSTGGITTNVNYLGVEDYIECKPNTTYTITFEDDIEVSGNIAYLYVSEKAKDGTFISRTGFSTNRTFTTGANTYYIFPYLNRTGFTFTKIGGYIQLEYGNKTPYTPYQSQEYEINLGIENFLPNPIQSQTLNGITVTRSADGVLTLNGTSTAITYFDFSTDFNTTLYAGYKFYGFPTNPQGLGIRISTSNRSSLQDIGSNGTALNDNGTGKYIALRIGSGITLSNYVLKPMLVSPTITNPDYTPYGVAPIELCKIGTYQDYLYKSGENWYKHKEIGKVVLDESSNISVIEKITAYNKFIWRYITAIDMAGIGARANILSNYYTGDTTVYGQNNKLGVYVNSSGLTNFSTLLSTIGATTESTNAQILALLQTWLSTHNTIIYYPLATPTEEQITNAELIEQLNAILNAVSYEDQTNISQENDNLGFIISASTSNMADITVINIGNIYAKPLMTINGSGNIEVYLNGIQVLQIALGDNQTITIDVSKMEAYNSSTQALLNRLVTGDYMNFLINSGNNTIGFRGSVTSVTIDNYTRWL